MHGAESSFNHEEHLDQISIAAENLNEAVGLLKEMGIFSKGGLFMSDIDNTLRTTREGALSGKPGYVSEESFKFIEELRQNGWFFGTISNRSGTLARTESAIASKLGYKSFDDLEAQADFALHSEGSLFAIGLKGKPETLDKVQSIIGNLNQETGGNLKNRYIVWMGDSYTDEEFGKNMFLQLREQGYKNLVLIKLEGRLGDYFGHDNNAEERTIRRTPPDIPEQN